MISILHIPKWFPDNENPQAAVFIKEHIRSVSKKTNSVVAVFSLDNTIKKSIEISQPKKVEEGYYTVTIKYKRPFIISGQLLYNLSFIKLMIKLRGIGLYPDIVHGHVYSVGVPLLIAKVIFRRKLVITEHFSVFIRGGLSKEKKLFARILFRIADIVLPVSKNLNDAIVKIDSRIKTKIIPNIVDLSSFKPSKNIEKYFICVGNIIPDKGMDSVIKEFSKFSKINRDYILIIVGDNTKDPCYVKTLEALIGQKSLSDKVFILGKRNKKELARLMANSTALLIGSKYETFGVIVIEALASNTTIISTDVGIVSQIIKLGKVYITGENFHEGSRYMEKATKSRPNNNLKKIEQDYSPQSVGTLICNVYDNLS